MATKSLQLRLAPRTGMLGSTKQQLGMSTMMGGLLGSKSTLALVESLRPGRVFDSGNC